MGIVILQTRHKVSFNIFTERWALTLIQSIISRKPSFVQLLFDEGIISCLDDVEITEITEISTDHTENTDFLMSHRNHENLKIIFNLKSATIIQYTIKGRFMSR